jgi:hypothetical protein
MLQPVTEAQKAYPPDHPEVRPRKVPKEDGMAQRGDLSSKIEKDAGKDCFAHICRCNAAWIETEPQSIK